MFELLTLMRSKLLRPAANTLGASEIHTICRRGVLVRSSSTTEVDGVSQTEVAPVSVLHLHAYTRRSCFLCPDASIEGHVFAPPKICGVDSF